MGIKPDKITDAEAEIMKVIWEHSGPATYSHIRSALAGRNGWESPTVNTLVSRLVKKGILAQEKKDVYYYTALVSEEEYTQAKTKSFVQKVYGGNVKGLMSALLSYGDMTGEDLEELRMQWNQEGGEKLPNE